MKIAVGIATAGRRDLLSSTVAHLTRQTRMPDQVIICPASSDDFDPTLHETLLPISVVRADTIGSSAQRNQILSKTDADIVVFFDDDFVPSKNYICEVEYLFAKNPQIVLASGNVIVDGARGRGLSFADAARIADRVENAIPIERVSEIFNAYGCNMSIRMKTVVENNVFFDENLPLYSWQEDVDFSRMISPFGKIVRSLRLRGVHMGYKISGRCSGKHFGYSQFANQIYLAEKGIITFPLAWRYFAFNFSMNICRSFWPEEWIDRRGRLHGNLLALLHFVMGTMHPSRILEFRDPDIKTSERNARKATRPGLDRPSKM